MDLLFPLLIIFFAVFTQSLSGFGVALVSMAVLPGILGIQNASSLVALVGLTLEFILLLRYRAALNWRTIRPMALASILAIPLGVTFLRRVDESITLGVLGVVIAGYALYALLNLKMPRLNNPLWAYAAGFLAGLLSGAFNTGGPPLVMYGNASGWKPAEFKSNLQSLFLINDVLVTASHLVSGHYTLDIVRIYLWALPVIALGIWAGVSLDKRLDPALFRRIVLVLLVVLGIRLLL